MMKTVRFIVVAVVLLCCLRMAGQTFVVVDSQDKRALPSASVFDKNGTLTYGTPRVVLVHSALPSLSDNELYRLCAAAEHYF